MAIGWITALKVIPWGDVIEAAPQIVKGARKFFARTRQVDPAADAPLAVDSERDEASLARARIEQLETRLAEMAEQQQASAGLIESLAEQNAKLVQVLDVLRMRVKLALIVAACLAIALLALAGWVLR